MASTRAARNFAFSWFPSLTRLQTNLSLPNNTKCRRDNLMRCMTFPIGQPQLVTIYYHQKAAINFGVLFAPNRRRLSVRFFRSVDCSSDAILVVCFTTQTSTCAAIVRPCRNIRLVSAINNFHFIVPGRDIFSSQLCMQITSCTFYAFSSELFVSKFN